MRHAYAVNLQPARLAALAELLVSLHGELARDLEAFTHVLAGGDGL